MEIEEFERIILEKVKADHLKCGGANGTDINEIDKLINQPIEERNKLFDKMVSERKLAYLKPLNQVRITLPK